MLEYFAHGKLLLSGEYLVLNGAKALALPTVLGQSMQISASDGNSIRWQALDCQGNIWLESYFMPDTLDMMSSDDIRKAQVLQKILRYAKKLSPGFLLQGGIRINTQLHFERNWGLGSSSTLVALIAQWAGVDPFELFDGCMTGSGYDIACAIQEKPLFYQHTKGKRHIETAEFRPSFTEQLRFVFLGEKQLSSEEVRKYSTRTKPDQLKIDQISAISEAFAHCEQLTEFEKLMREHEALVGDVLGRKPIGETIFAGYPGAVKSMGAWGGDFALATAPAPEAADRWLAEAGFHTVVSYDHLFG
jgi:mevalonate kinase